MMTDIDKVKELVEWAATGIEANTCRACGCTGEDCEGCTWLPSLDIKKLARQILSHPDLCLVNNDDLKPYGCDVKDLPVIPLAEAILKEAE